MSAGALVPRSGGFVLTEEQVDNFAREYIRCNENAAQAVRRARIQNPQYSMTLWVDRLLESEAVNAAIDRHRALAESMPRRLATRESIADDFETIFERALEAEEYSPAVTAKAKQAELLGFMEKNVRLTVSTDVSKLSMEELERELARLQENGVVQLKPLADGTYGVSDGDADD